MAERSRGAGPGGTPPSRAEGVGEVRGAAAKRPPARTSTRRSLPRDSADDVAGSPDENDVQRRRIAAASAGYEGDEQRARDALVDPSPAVRAAALASLARLHAATPDDLEAAVGDRSPVVRRHAVELAPAFPSRSWAGLLDDPDPLVVEAACFAVGELADKKGVDRLCEIAARHGDPLCREAAVAALGAIGEAKGKAAVLAALSDRPEVRRRAVVALSAFDGDDVTEALRARLDDRDWQVRQAAEDVLALNEQRRS